MSNLDKFIEENKADMIQDLTSVVENLKSWMRTDAQAFTEFGSEEPSTDIRLCIDLEGFSPYRSESWIFRTGPSDYDPVHSQYCSASSIGLDTDAKDLLAELIGGLNE